MEAVTGREPRECDILEIRWRGHCQLRQLLLMGWGRGTCLPPPHRPGVKCGLVYTPALKHGKYDCLADHPVFVSDTGQESLQQQSLPAWRNLPQPPRFLFLYVSITVEGESPSPWLKIMMSQHQWFAWNPPDLFNSPSKVSRILWSPESE